MTGEHVKPVYDRWGIRVFASDCLDVMRGMPDNSVSAIITDPPAAIKFMGREWDSDRGGRDQWVAWLAERMREAMRLLKPGGHALVWALPRTSHWTALALEDAGFEIRDCVIHIFGQGFAKSRNISKDIDSLAGLKQPVIGSKLGLPGYSLAPSNGDHRTYGRGLGNTSDPEAECAITAPVTAAAKLWDGWGTNLKPSQEMWWLCRKPFRGTVAANVLAHGTGALNIDASRVAVGQDYLDKCAPIVELDSNRNGAAYGEWAGARTDSAHVSGRWPANVVLSHCPLLDPATDEVLGDACADGCVEGCPVAELDHQSKGTRAEKPSASGTVMGSGMWGIGSKRNGSTYADSGGASRFFHCFRWEAKAPSATRPKVNGKQHPTVKPVQLLRFFARLSCPPGGVILDCFAGTGTTGQAARAEGFPAILIEQDPDAIDMIRARLDALPKTDAPTADNTRAAAAVQGDLFDLLGGEKS